MTKDEEKLLQAIDQDVRSNADIVTKRIHEETDNLRDEQISFYKEGLNKETSTYLEAELNELNLNAAIEKSRARLDTKKKLLELRQSLTNDLFSKVEEDLDSFTKTDAYITYLSDHLHNIQVNQNGWFIVRENDVEMFKMILKENNLTNEVKTGYFALGGFRYVDPDQKLEYSCLLSDGEDAAKKWFRDHSDFKVSDERTVEHE